MSAAYIGYLFGALGMELIVGYVVGALIGIKKRRKAALIGALVASLFVAYLSCGPTPNAEWGPLVVWLLVATFFGWRIGWNNKATQEAVETPPAT